MERKYQVYTEMTRKIEKIIDHLMSKYNCLHEPFIAVSDEDERLYFLDMEYLDTNGKYQRFYGRISEANIMK